MARAGLIAALLPVLLLVLAGCAGDPYAGYRILPDAVQRPHPQAVPHTDRTGAPMAAYDPLRSFLPLGLSGALADYAIPGTTTDDYDRAVGEGMSDHVEGRKRGQGGSGV